MNKITFFITLLVVEVVCVAWKGDKSYLLKDDALVVYDIAIDVVEIGRLERRPASRDY